MSRDQNKGSMLQEGTGSTCQSAGTFSHKVCHLDICQNVENVSYTYPGRQHGSLDLFAENGRDKESKTNADLKGNLGVSTWVRDHDHCRIFTRESQLQGRLGFSAPERSSEWKLRPLIFSKICQRLGKKPEIDLFASRLSNQLPGYCSWKPDAKRHRCSSTEMVSQESICIPSIYLDSQSTEKSRGGQSAFSKNRNSNLANLKLVPRTPTSFSEKSNHFANHFAKGPQNQQHHLIQN